MSADGEHVIERLIADGSVERAEQWEPVAKQAPDVHCPVEDRQEELEVCGWTASATPDGPVRMSHPTVSGWLTVEDAWSYATAED